MKIFEFVFLLISVGFSVTFGNEASSEDENPTNTIPESLLNDRQMIEPEFKAMEKKSNNPTRRRKIEHLITPDEKLIIIKPRLQKAQYMDDGLAIPYLGFPTVDTKRQNIYFSDDTGEYDLTLDNFQQGKSSNFQTALGAISAHILNQRSRQEYIPYPPNGNPYNHPAYRGYPRAVEPHMIRAYEKATNLDHSDRRADFFPENPRRPLPAADYQTSFPDQFPNFLRNYYSDREF